MTANILPSDSSSTFKHPPRNLPLELALDFHYRENPTHPAIIHPTEDGFLRSYTYQELVPAVHRAGRWISEAINFSRPESTNSVPTVVVLLKTDTMSYLTTVAGLMRAGVIVFPISPRFSSTVIAHLLRTHRPDAIVFNEGSEPILNQALEESLGDGYAPELCRLPAFDTWYLGHDDYEPLPEYERRADDITIMAHSSSSSSLYPKVVRWSTLTILHHGNMEESPARELAGRVLGGFGLELFHGLGLCIFFKMVLKGLILAVLDPSLPESVLPADPECIFQSVEAIQPDILLTNPRLIELWGSDPAKLPVLRGATLIYGGRFLSRSIGNKLVENGVKLCSSYGATEIGPIALLPNFQGKDWEYWSVEPRSDLNFIRRSDGLFELVLTPTKETSYRNISNTIQRGLLAYNPGDLFQAHPTKARTFKIFGRSTDQIMLATGEMVNPIEIECELAKHPKVSTAVMFGHSRFSVGMVIEPVSSNWHDKARFTEEKRLIDELWPIIETFNCKSPPYTCISRKMIVIANSKKPIMTSVKGLPRRPAVWLDYQEEIDALYANDLRVRK